MGRTCLGLAMAGLMTLVVPAAPSRAESAAAVLAAQAPTQEDQCKLLRQLCHAAVVASDRAGSTPWSSRTDTLIYSQNGKAALYVSDARDAARVIVGRNGDRHLPCYDDPECAFLKLPKADTPRPR